MPKPPGDSAQHDDAEGGAAGGREQVIHVATRCASVDEFVERFAAFAWEGSLVLPAASRLPIGTQGRFVIVLKDQRVVMRGRCRVTEAKPAPPARNPAAAAPRFMLRVSLTDMDEVSREVHRRLIALRSAPVPLPVPPEPSETTQIESGRSGAPIPAPPAPVPPIPARPAPLPPPVRLNQTMIGVGPMGRIPGTPAPPYAAVPVHLPAPVAVSAPVPVPVHDTAPVEVVRETRVPGAPDTLPANPLSELKVDDLSSFIETTLMEEDLDSGSPASGAAATAAPVASGRQSLLAPAQRLAAMLPPQARALVKRWGPLAGSTIAGLVIGFALRGSPPTAPAKTAAVAPQAPAAVAAAAPPAAAAVAPKSAEREPQREIADSPKAAEPQPRRVAAPKPAPVVVAAAAADGSCTARVITEPKDARVIWAGKLLGRTPLPKAAVPCGAAEVTLDRDRYQAVTLDVTAEARAMTSVREKLHRPRGTLLVTSTPPGAQVTFNRQPIGVTPRRIEVSRYEKLPVKVTLSGYAPWSKSVYLKDPETKVDAQLVPR
jgi:hypothetical protein